MKKTPTEILELIEKADRIEVAVPFNETPETIEATWFDGSLSGMDGEDDNPIVIDSDLDNRACVTLAELTGAKTEKNGKIALNDGRFLQFFARL